MDWIKQKGKNIATKITADKLFKAWRVAKSPTDSDTIANVLRDAGVPEQVLLDVYASVGLEVPVKPEQPEKADTTQTTTQTAGATKQEPTLNADVIMKAIQNMTPAQLQSLSRQLEQTPKLHPDIKVMNTVPMVLRYRNQDYALSDDNRTWVKFGSDKPASPEMTEFLHKQLRAL
jgi:hypothetical protein